jgi:(p)ppGpp synthase/HD superfamily hydrolase
MTGYSDRINHALAFAAKHHDQQVRKGTRSPYLTQPANVAIILTRYACNEDVVVAGILHDVVEDCLRDGWTDAMLSERIGEKFGHTMLAMLRAVTERRTDDDGIEMAAEDRKDDLLARMAEASPDALWVGAADAVHQVNAILSDLRRTTFPESVWARYPAGRDAMVRWYQRVASRMHEVGFTASIVDELTAATNQLAAL